MKRTTLLANFVLAALVSLPVAAKNPSAMPSPAMPQQPTTITQISGTVTHFYYLVTTGPGQYDHIGVHRVTLVDRSGNPRPSQNAVLMVHGDFWPFDHAFLGGGSRNSAAAYLASQGIDVWGIDLAWTLVPSGETNFSFMRSWGMQHDINDIETSLTFARSVRSQTGSDSGPLTLLAWSRGGWLGYGLVNQESQMSCGQRQVKAYIPVDNSYKTDSPASQQFFCSSEASDLQNIANGVYNVDARIYGTVGQYAIQAPDAGSPPSVCGSPFTNLTCSLWVAAAIFQGGTTPTPYYHFAAGFWPDGNFQTGIPAGLKYSNIGQWNGFEVGVAPYEPMQLAADTDAVTCGDDPNLPFDKHLSDVTLPVHYVGAGGGFGSYGLYTLSLLGSRHVTNHIVSFYPPEDQALDFGHVDLFYADNAQDLVWSDILVFLQGQRYERDDRCNDK
jgi:hypothetical protein